LIFFSMASESE